MVTRQALERAFLMSMRVGAELRRWLADRRGVSSLEYGILAAAVVIAVATMATPLGTLATELMQTILATIPA